MMWQMWNIPAGSGWWMAFGGVWMILLSIGIIVLIVWGIIKLTQLNGSNQKSSPLDTARGRYAGGEISREEFELIKKDLT